jgi:hypothetical protein
MNETRILTIQPLPFLVLPFPFPPLLILLVISHINAPLHPLLHRLQHIFQTLDLIRCFSTTLGYLGVPFDVFSLEGEEMAVEGFVELFRYCQRTKQGLSLVKRKDGREKESTRTIEVFFVVMTVHL